MSAPTSEIERIHIRLDELQRSDPHLAQAAAYYRTLADLLNSGPLLAPLPVSPQTARARLAAGQILLAAEPPVFARAAAEHFFRQVCGMLQPFQAGAEAAAADLDQGRIDLVTLLETLLSSPNGELEAAAETGQAGSLTLRVLLEYTLRPTLRAWSRQLAEMVALQDWQRSICPVCGTAPLLAELHKSQHLRLLRCGFCGSAWPYPIRKCVHCGNEDPQTQSLIANHDDERLFAQTCKRCKVYIKSIFTEDGLPHDLLSLEDLASLYLDEGCQKNGYLRTIESEGF